MCNLLKWDNLSIIGVAFSLNRNVYISNMVSIIHVHVLIFPCLVIAEWSAMRT